MPSALRRWLQGGGRLRTRLLLRPLVAWLVMRNRSRQPPSATISFFHFVTQLLPDILHQIFKATCRRKMELFFADGFPRHAAEGVCSFPAFVRIDAGAVPRVFVAFRNSFQDLSCGLGLCQ